MHFIRLCPSQHFPAGTQHSRTTAAATVEQQCSILLVCLYSQWEQFIPPPTLFLLSSLPALPKCSSTKLSQPFPFNLNTVHFPLPILFPVNGKEHFCARHGGTHHERERECLLDLINHRSTDLAKWPTDTHLLPYSQTHNIKAISIFPSPPPFRILIMLVPNRNSRCHLW